MMGNIDWIPIADMPDALKDGRDVLLWETTREVYAPAAPYRAVVGRLVGDVWIDADGCTIRGASHFAEVNPPA